jgi:FKBP-type peptidyl-prolyl cis-trans isomerase SlyD
MTGICSRCGPDRGRSSTSTAARTSFPAWRAPWQDEVQARVPPAEAYGLRNEMLIQTVPRALFGYEAIKIGDRYEGYSSDGSTVDVTVVAIADDEVIVDANHPLAGMALNFEATVMAVRDASPEEIVAGRVLLPLPAIH